MIRLARTEDIEVLAAVEISAAEKFAVHLGIEIPEGQTVANELLISAQNLGMLWVAEENDGVVGFVVCGKLDNFLHIEELSVCFEYQGRGLGKALLEAIISYACENQFDGISLTTDRVIPWNAPYYSKSGFQDVAFEKCFPELKAVLQRDKLRSPHPDNRIAMILKF